MTGTTPYDVLDAVACRLAGVSGWRFDPVLRRFTLSPRAAALLALDATAPVEPERLFGRFARPGRDLLAAALERAAGAGARFDLVLDPVDGHGPGLLVSGEAAPGGGAGPPHVIGAMQRAPARRDPVGEPGDDPAADSRHLNERLQLALDAAGMGVWERPIDSPDYDCDERLRNMYNLGPGETWTRSVLLGQMHEEDRPRFLAAVTAADDAGRPATVDFRVVAPTGEVRHHRTHSIIQKGPDGRRRVVGVVEDVTRDARLREEIERRRREAEAATEAKSQFLAVVSHEIRTPLNGVLGMASLLETTALGAEQQSMLAVIRGSGELLMTVLNDILDFSKIESGQIDIERVPFSLADTVLHSAALNRPKADSSGIGFFVSFEGDVRRPRLGDAHRIGQILNNLVGNALKFTRDGSVTFAVRADETDRVTIEVTDTGIGMSPEQAERVFHPFTQADPSITRRYGGTGLGLTIAERLARAMGGDIAIETRLGAGTTMRVTLALPLAPEPAPGAD